MRLVFALGLALAACAGREPVRFGSPMLGMASVPPPALRRLRPEPTPARSSAGPARASAAEVAHPEVAGLPARHLPQPPAARVKTPVDLHDLVGRREQRPPFEVTLGWARDLGLRPDAATAGELIAWAERTHRLHGAGEVPEPGDLLVFDRTRSDDTADLLAIVIARDPRNVIEMIYVAGGAVRRGFVDAARPALRRDREGAVVNTYLRHGKRSPPPGTHYLAGELLANVVSSRSTSP